MSYELDYCSGRARSFNVNSQDGKVSEEFQQYVNWFHLYSISELQIV